VAADSPQRGALASQINVTPLVDVMLVLLIIFMVTAPIIQQGVEVNLPKVKAQALPGKEEQFIISITRNRELYLNDTRMSDEQLSAKLKAISVDRPNRQVFLRADDAVPYGEVVRTMAAIKAAGIEDVGMVTEMPLPGSEDTKGVEGGSKRGSPGP
jgi:biopolymer transport protein TolR